MVEDRQDEKTPKLAPSSGGEEEDDLEAFCASVQYEDIPFEKWCQHNDQLDLQYPVTIYRDQLKQTFRTVIRLSRSVRKTDCKTEAGTREKIEHELILDYFEGPEKVIRVCGLGDILGDEVGDLCIIVRVKD